MSSLPVRFSVSRSHLFILLFGIIKGLKDLSPKKRQKLCTKMELWKIYEESDWGLIIFSFGPHPLMPFTCHLPIWKLLDWGLGRGEFFAKLTQFRLPLGWTWKISCQPLCLFCAFLGTWNDIQKGLQLEHFTCDESQVRIQWQVM